MKTLILGLGNPILSDDSVGIKVADELRKVTPPLNAEIRESSVAGLTILDELEGFDRAIMVDSIKTMKGQPGNIYKLKTKDFTSTAHLSNSHGIDFFTAMEFGKKIGYKIPRIIDIYAVEVEDNTTFSEHCTPQVEASIAWVVQEIKKEVTLS